MIQKRAINPLLLDLPTEISTERLLLRVPRPGDGATVNAAVHESLAELRPWMPWAAGDVPVEESESYCRRCAGTFLTREDFQLLMFERSSGAFAGGCGLHRINWDVPLMEIGYWVRTSMCGRGYATESTRRLLMYAMETLGAARVEIRIDDRNVASQRVAERAGFEFEGVNRSIDRGPDGQLRDMRIYACVTRRPDQR
jgi:ribosomal-protein-serine acetyltransferase